MAKIRKPYIQKIKVEPEDKQEQEVDLEKKVKTLTGWKQHLLTVGFYGLIVGTCALAYHPSQKIGKYVAEKSIELWYHKECNDGFKKVEVFEEPPGENNCNAENLGIPHEYCEVAYNLVKIFHAEKKFMMQEIKAGTGIFINSRQIITADHILSDIASEKTHIIKDILKGNSHKKSTSSKYLINYLTFNLDLDFRHENGSSKSDLNVLTLPGPIPTVFNLQFYEGVIKEGLEVTLITYDPTKSNLNIKDGEIIDIGEVCNGVNWFETDIPAHGGNSGGVYVKKGTGKLVGIIRASSDYKNNSIGSSISNLKITKRNSPKKDSEENAEELMKIVSFKMPTIDNFESGQFYIKDNEICSLLFYYNGKQTGICSNSEKYSEDIKSITQTFVQKDKHTKEIIHKIEFRDGKKCSVVEPVSQEYSF